MEGDSGIVEELKNIVEVLQDKEDYEEDWWVYSKIAGRAGNCLAAVRPKNEKEVSDVIKFCYEKGISVTCRGGGSSVTGASVPLQGILMDMSAMNKIINVDIENSIATVEAGIVLKKVEEALNAYGYTLGHFPQSFELATVGGFISTMGTGEFSNYYGGIEDSCISLRIVLPDGSIIDTKKSEAPRSSTGPDLTRLFVGAEGMLGVIVSVTLKIHKIPSITCNLAFSFPSFEHAVYASKQLLDFDIKPALCRIYNEDEANFLFGIRKVMMLLIYYFRSRNVMDSILKEVKDFMRKESAIEEDTHYVDKWLESRYRFREQTEFFSRANLVVETAEVAALWSRVYSLYEDVVRNVSNINGVHAVGAHVSHIYNEGACIYFSIILDSSKEAYRSIWQGIEYSCIKNKATVSHHHGVGMLKSDMVKKEIPYSLLEKIKRAMDEKAIMNPGKLL